MKRVLITLCIILIPGFIFAQNVLTGTVIDGETGKVLPGANVVEKGTSNGTITGLEGEFSLNTQERTGDIVISFVGYKSLSVPFNLSQTSSIGQIELNLDALSMEGVVIVGVGVIDVAKDRETPVAVSTITADEIITKTGNQEFPEVMKNTPSVYVTSQAGGYGDSRLSIRGFDQENLALLFNGQPVNGMEDGKVYWSNWQGLSDIASAVQIQRGLGSSKLAISSVGATINIITKATEMKAGGRVSALLGNDNYMKYTAGYSTGLNEKGWGSSVLLSHWQGNGYNDGTEGMGQTYLISIGYKPSEKHQFNFSLTGAPQWHHQNYTKRISEYDLDGDGNITNEEQRYNSNWGYKDGEVFSWRKNFYHKPVMNLNWDWIMSDKSSLSTVAYASWGQGGGTGPYGASRDAYVYGDNNQIDFDQIVANNSSIEPNPENGLIEGRYGTAAIRRGSMNIHNWYGLVTNFNHEISQNLSFNLGADLRTYFGEHYRLVDNLLGLQGYWDDNFRADGFQTLYPGGQLYTREYPSSAYHFLTMYNNTDDFKLDYFNTERISYGGLFGQLEYKTQKISSYIQGAVSSQTYQRFDYHTYALPENQASEKLANPGFNIKTGANYNLTDNHNVFMNAGYYSRQPFFDDLYVNYTNEINEEVGNESVLGLELGYGYRSYNLDVDFNAYNTVWSDRQLRRGVELGEGNFGTAYYENVAQIHRGVELEVWSRPVRKLQLGGFASIGNWVYGGDVTATVFDESQNFLGESTIYLDDVKVGNAAQTSFGVLAEYEIVKGLKVDADYRYYDRLYASIDPTSFTDEDHEGSLQLPSFGLLDAGASYRMLFKNYNSLRFRLNVNNVLNNQYISQSSTNTHAGEGDETFNGINVNNRVYFGNGLTWNFSVSYKF